MKAQLWPNCTNTRLSLSNRLSLFSAHAPTTHLIDCLYLPSACMLYHLHTGTSFNLSPLSRTSPLPTSSRDPFLFPTRRGVIYPKDELWKNNLCLPSPACSSLFGDLEFSEAVFLDSPQMCHQQGRAIPPVLGGQPSSSTACDPVNNDQPISLDALAVSTNPAFYHSSS